MKLLVLFGGASSEHEVSCLSVASILRNIDRDKFVILSQTFHEEWSKEPCLRKTVLNRVCETHSQRHSCTLHDRQTSFRQVTPYLHQMPLLGFLP